MSYLPESQLFRPRAVRQEALENWGFHCQCSRCLGHEDVRSFICPHCEREISETDDGYQCCCGHKLNANLEDLEKQWQQSLAKARRSPPAAAALWKGPRSLGAKHYLVSEAARLATETLNPSVAISAARHRWRFAKATLPGFSRTAAEALEMSALALSMGGRSSAALSRFKRAWHEAVKLLGSQHALPRRIQRQQERMEGAPRIGEKVSMRIWFHCVNDWPNFWGCFGARQCSNKPGCLCGCVCVCALIADINQRQIIQTP